MICYIKDYEDSWLTMKLQVWDDNKLTYETPVAKVDKTNESAERIAKMRCFVNLYSKLGIEAAQEIINLIPTYDMEE